MLSRGVLVFTLDGAVSAIRDASVAASYVQAMDVVDGEHEAFFTVGGDIMRPSVRPMTRSGSG
jgi:hypothetical protein